MNTSPLSSTTHRTPVGELTIIASERGLHAILWPKTAPHRAPIDSRARRNPDHPILRRTAAQLDEYFAGTRTRFDIPLDLRGTRFQVAAWRALADIPFGATTTYGQQAAALGVPTAARALGAANRANPVCIILPCHRVIGANGSLTGFAGGLEVKQWLLDHEAHVLARAPHDSPSPLAGEPQSSGSRDFPRGQGRGEGADRDILSTPQWPARQPIQTRLSMPVA